MRWPFRRRDPVTPTEPHPVAHHAPAPRHHPTGSDADRVRQIASTHLSEPDLSRWLGLLRPAVRLHATDDADAVVARLGGLPRLPDDVEWPTWSGHGPLSFIGELDCERLTGFPLDVPLPSTGRLLFFYRDGAYDDDPVTVGTWDAATLEGARALHVDDGSPREAPEGTTTYPEQRYAGRSVVTAPDWQHPDLEAAFTSPGQDAASLMEHPVTAEAFAEELRARHHGPGHQVGGYADPVQGPVEHEVALAALANQVRHGDPRLDEEALRWELLLQVDTDDDLEMMWGDIGTLYWMTRGDQPWSAASAAEVLFTWQCS
jgi:uncharacterized protein YwqG